MQQRASFPPVLRNGRRGFHVKSSRPRFTQGLSSLKSVKPQSWQRLFEPSTNSAAKPSKSACARPSARDDFSAVIDENSFLNEKSQRSFLSPALQVHIERLYEQIGELTLQLSEERFRHKQTQLKVKDVLASRTRDQSEQFQALLVDKLRDHQHQLQEQEDKHQKLLVDEQARILQREEQWQSELNFVKHSFHIYKINLHQTEKPSVRPNETIDPKSQQRRTVNEDRAMIEKQHLIEPKGAEKMVSFEDEESTTSDPTDPQSLQKALRRARVELKKRKAQVEDLTDRLKQLDSQYQEVARRLNETHQLNPSGDI